MPRVKILLAMLHSGVRSVHMLCTCPLREPVREPAVFVLPGNSLHLHKTKIRTLVRTVKSRLTLEIS